MALKPLNGLFWSEICCLGEVTAPQFCFEIYWPLRSYENWRKISWNCKCIWIRLLLQKGFQPIKLYLSGFARIVSILWPLVWPHRWTDWMRSNNLEPPSADFMVKWRSLYFQKFSTVWTIKYVEACSNFSIVLEVSLEICGSKYEMGQKPIKNRTSFMDVRLYQNG